MKQKLVKITGTTCLYLLFVLTSFGQTQSCIRGDFKITKTTKELDNVQVVISQFKSLTQTDPLCRADIKILKDGVLLDSIKISADQFDAVGDRYGLLIYEKQIKNHIVITKFGSYNGQTIIINNKGQKFTTLGGFSSLDNENGLLFSIYHSDLPGFSVFDLNKDKELFSTTLSENRPLEFYLIGEKYFVKTISDATKEGIFEIDFKRKKIIEKNIATKIKENCLDKLADYKFLNVDCQ